MRQDTTSRKKSETKSVVAIRTDVEWPVRVWLTLLWNVCVCFKYNIYLVTDYFTYFFKFFLVFALEPRRSRPWFLKFYLGDHLELLFHPSETCLVRVCHTCDTGSCFFRFYGKKRDYKSYDKTENYYTNVLGLTSPLFKCMQKRDSLDFERSSRNCWFYKDKFSSVCIHALESYKEKFFDLHVLSIFLVFCSTDF